MAGKTRRGSTPVRVPAEVSQLALRGLDEAMDVERADWTACDQFELGQLVALLGPLDAGVMLRSGDRGRAVACGVFVGGQSQWTTCRNDRELLAILEACVVSFTHALGSRQAPEPTPRARRAQKSK